MFGKDYIFTVQAINKLQKMSLISDQAIFSVIDPSKQAVVHKTTASSAPTQSPLASPITKFEATEATTGHINLKWENVEDATDYKLFWDKGDNQQTSLFFPITASTDGKNEYTVDKANSGSILGSAKLIKSGGTFHFKVSYKSIKTKQESEMSQSFEVVVKP
jgi:hypothetical protein